MELLFKKCNPIRLLTIFPESSVVGFWLDFHWPLKYKTEIHERKILSSASRSIEPWLIWFSYLTIPISIGARQNRMRWLLSHQITATDLSLAALQIRAGQWSVTPNLWPLTTHIYHVMITVTGGFSKKSLLLFPKNYFEQSWTCYLGI